MSTQEKSRSDRRNIEGEVAQEKRMEMCRNSDGCHSSSENKKNGDTCYEYTFKNYFWFVENFDHYFLVGYKCQYAMKNWIQRT